VGIITSILILSFLIFFHELGHFLAARYFGVRVEVFSVGFGKEIFKKEYKGTIYQLAIIPLGGYVKMKGQDDSNPMLKSYDSDSYTTKTPWERIGILFAGPFANFLLAFILYFIVSLGASNEFAASIGGIKEESPSSKAGLMLNDKIVRINSTDIHTWRDIGEVITNSNGKIKLYIQRDGKLITAIVEPKILTTKNIFNEDEKRKLIGISPNGELVEVHRGLFESISHSFDRTYEASKMIFLGVKKLLEGVIPSSEVGGVISIVKVTSDATEFGFMALLALTALISVNLGVLNLLPIPALDGGHIIFNLYEIITKKAPSEKVLYQLTLGGWVVLLGLMGLGIYNDINRLLG
jgi:regulator of sigma E protease